MEEVSLKFPSIVELFSFKQIIPSGCQVVIKSDQNILEGFLAIADVNKALETYEATRLHITKS